MYDLKQHILWHKKVLILKVEDVVLRNFHMHIIYKYYLQYEIIIYKYLALVYHYSIFLSSIIHM
jgi:hypothetical protein